MKQIDHKYEVGAARLTVEKLKAKLEFDKKFAAQYNRDKLAVNYIGEGAPRSYILDFDKFKRLVTYVQASDLLIAILEASLGLSDTFSVGNEWLSIALGQQDYVELSYFIAEEGYILDYIGTIYDGSVL